MRLTSEFWVSALVRRVFGAGDFAAVLNKGAAEAGAVHIIVRDRMGNASLYRPAPQALYDDARPQDRRFEAAGELQWDAIEAWLQKERRFDPDIWVVELELGSLKIAELIELGG